MARPRKNRIGEYAELLGEELGRRFREELSRALSATRAEHALEVAALRAELRNLARRIETLARKERTTRARVGRWVPGGPGRPPKDAAERIAAFEARMSGRSAPTRGRPSRASKTSSSSR